MDNQNIEKEKMCRAMGLLMYTNRLHKKVVDRHVTTTGMHSSQHRMLMHLASKKRVGSQKEIAEHFEVSTAAVAITLKKMEHDGYIAKEKNTEATDARYNEILVTEKGREAISLTREFFEKLDEKAFQGISEEEIDGFISMLEKLRENLEAVAENG